MKIATFNINSIRARAATFLLWLKEKQPDIVFLQEIKCETEDFLYFECESLGYKTAVLGQKSYNGVAILSKYDFVVTARNLPDFADEAQRYIEILVHSGKQNFYAASLYIPNGCAADKTVEEQKLQYKLAWLDALYRHLLVLQKNGLPIVLGGDFNVMMRDIDVYNPDTFKGSPLFIKPVQDRLTALGHIGFHDAFRSINPDGEGYTFWDYTANSFVTNSGLRIDYLMVTVQLAEKLISCAPDKSLRMTEKPSDHTPLVAEFED